MTSSSPAQLKTGSLGFFAIENKYTVEIGFDSQLISMLGWRMVM